MTSSTHNLATTKAASKREHFLNKAPHEKKDSYADTLVSQYGSNFSNPDQLRWLQTARPKTVQNSNNMRAGKSSAAEVLNVVMSEKKNGAGEVPKFTSNPGPLLVDNKVSKEGDSQGSFSTTAATRAWDYVKAMTHPNTPLLLLSPLPALEDSVLFAIDQSVGVEFDNREIGATTRQKGEAVEKVLEQPVKGNSKIKSESEMSGHIQSEGNSSNQLMGDDQKSSPAHLEAKKDKGEKRRREKQEQWVDSKRKKMDVSSKEKGADKNLKAERRSRSQSSSRSRSTSLSPTNRSDDRTTAKVKQEGKPKSSMYSSNDDDQCKYKPKEREPAKYKEKEETKVKVRDRDAKKGNEEREKRADKNKESRSRADAKADKKKTKSDSKEKTTQPTTERRREDAHPVSAGKLKEEATKLKHLADNVFKTNRAEGLNYYLFAGLKFLECCQQLEKEADNGKHDVLKSALVMYRETAKFFDNCGGMCVNNKEQSRASLCYKCMAVALARAFNIQKEKLKRTRDELWGHLNKAAVASSPVSGNSTNTGRASSMSPSPTYRSIPSPLSGGSAPSQPPGILQKELFLLAEIDDVFRALEAWHKADVHCGLQLSDLEVPFTLDAFLTAEVPPISAVIDYVHKATELL